MDEYQMKQLQLAYSILKDPQRKQLYDVYGDSYFDLDEELIAKVIDAIFPKEKKRPKLAPSRLRKGKPVLQKLPMSLKNIYIGKTLKIKITRHRACSMCMKQLGCRSCGGVGKITTLIDGEKYQEVCANCEKI